MKAIEINSQIETYEILPKSWGNVLGGFDLLSDEELKTYGFYDVIIPEYDIRIEGVGELYFDEENEIFKQDVIDLPFNESLTEMKNASINEFKNSVNQELKITDWYIIRNQETGEAIPNDITTAREELRNQTVTVENEINALTTKKAVKTYIFPELS